MKNLKLVQLLCVCFLITFSCTKDDDNKPIDPRLEYIGTYKISETEIRVINFAIDIDSTFTVDIDPTIKFELDNNLNDDELLVDMEEYIEDLYRAYFLAFGTILDDIDVDIDEDIIAQISGNDFEINNAEFEVRIVFEGAVTLLDNEMDIEGDFNGDSVTFDFEIEAETSTSQIDLTGESEGEKD